MAKLELTKAITDVTVNVLIQDSTSTTGAGLAGLVYNSAGLTCYYIHPRGTATALSLVTLAAVDSAHSDGGFKEIDATNVTGLYRLDLSDVIVAAGEEFVTVHLQGATNMAPVTLEIQLLDPVVTAAGTAAVSVPAESYTLTTGTQSSGTYSSTAVADGTEHQHTDAGGVMELYYQFPIGGDGIPTSVTFTGRVNGSNDDLSVWAYNFGGTAWEQIGTLNGKAQSTNDEHTMNLFATHIGTGANLGKVRIRFYAASGLTTATLSIDQIYASYVVVSRTVGYALGAIWLDTNASNTNTEDYVDGTADKPVSTWGAALTLSTSLGLKHFQVAGGSSFALSGNSDGYVIEGRNYTIALGGQSIALAGIVGATAVSGTATGSGARFEDCVFGTCTLDPFMAMRCAMSDTITLGTAGTVHFDQCRSEVAGTGTPNFDFGAALNSSALNMRHHSGGVEIENMGTGTGSYTMSLEGNGQIIANANCSATSTVAVRGAFTITDNASGAIVFSDAARFDVANVTTDIDANSTQLIAILADTNELENDWTNGGRLDLILDGIASAATLTAAEVRTEMDANSTQLAAIVADTNELQTDWTNGGRLDLLLDATLADTNELQGDWVNGGRLDLLLDATLADTNELQTDWVNGGRLDLLLDATLADTNELQTDWANAGRLDNLLDTAAGYTVPTAVQVRQEMDSNSTQLALIVADTNELQVDWANGGRLDLILDTAAVAGPTAAAIRTEIDSNSTQLTLIVADTSELQTDWTNGGRLDLILDSIAAGSTLTAAQVRIEMDANSTKLTAIVADTNELQVDWVNGGRLDLLLDATLADTNELQTDWVNGGRLDLLLDTASGYTVPTAVQNRQEMDSNSTVLNAAATSVEATAITAAIVAMQGATFSGATDSLEAIRNRGDAAWVTATGFSTLNAAGIRTAVGLGSANLDTQLADIPTVAELNARTIVAASYALEATLTAIKGATWSASTDTLEALRDRGDAAWTTATGFLSAATMRTAIGMSSANLDTQLGALDTQVLTRLATSGYTAPSNASIAAILVDTDATIPGLIAAIPGGGGDTVNLTSVGTNVRSDC